MLNRSIVVNNVEPSFLSMRAPMGIELHVGLRFSKQDSTPLDIAAILPVLALLPRSHGSVWAYDVEAVGGETGFGTVSIPGNALVDMAGYTLELYQRRPAEVPENPPVPNGMLAKGTLVLEGNSYVQYGPLGIHSVPVIQGAPGPMGPPGEQGTRGGIWTTGTGAPVTTGAEVNGDMYLDEVTGNVWRFSGTVWVLGTF